jgi:uncharacterized protein (TIGR03067 family)
MPVSNAAASRVSSVVLACVCLVANAFAGEPGSKPADEDASAEVRSLAGTWLPERAEGWHSSQLWSIRMSTLDIEGRSFALSKFRGLAKPVTGTITLDPTASPKRIDLRSDEIDLSPSGAPVKYPACTVPGIYELNGDRLTICFQTGSGPVRPKAFDASGPGCIRLVLRRAGAAFKGYPKAVALTVLDPSGKPVAGQSVFQFMRMMHDDHDPEAVRQWPYSPRKTDASGTTEVPYEDFAAAGVRDASRRLIGFATASPALLQQGTATLRLQPQCVLSGSISCGELTGAGKSIGWTNVYLITDGERIAACESRSGHYQFLVAPGDYTLNAYGEYLQQESVSVTVPAGLAEFHAPPIELTASHLDMLKGKPAPELAGIIAWKGWPVRLADVRGKYVLIDFWGYWCSPCVRAMPILIDLYQKYKDKGLAVLSVHVDMDGDVGTAAKLDEKIAGYRTSLWGGRDLPFPTALSAGRRTPAGYNGLTADQYGVLSYPTTILIDRQGNVVGEFSQAQDRAAAVAEIDRLLGSGK